MKTIPLLLAALVLCGCEKIKDQAMQATRITTEATPNVTFTNSGIDAIGLRAMEIELHYAAGVNDGLEIMRDIKDRVLTSEQAALERAATARSNYLAQYRK